jgi:hypothetical protein
MTPSKNKGHHADHNGTYSRRWRLHGGYEPFLPATISTCRHLRDGGIDSQTLLATGDALAIPDRRTGAQTQKEWSINGR